MRIIRTDERADYCKSGIHLYNPSKRKIEDAKEDASSRDCTVIYIHKNSPSLTLADKRFLRELNLFKKVFNCFESDF
jgi:hypothetical protein